MNKKIYVIAIFTTLIFIAVGSLIWWVKDRNTNINQMTTVSVRLAWVPGATFTGDFVALHKGFWNTEGLDVYLNPGGFEQDAIKLVAG